MLVDLHIHTTASDGTLTPTEAVRQAKAKGFEVIAITDHDTTDGLEEALQAGRELGVRVIPGIEITSGVLCEAHILAYGVDPNNPLLKKLLEDMRKTRLLRMEKIVAILRAYNTEITPEEVLAEANGAPVSRMHIARVMVDKGFVPSIDLAFRRYLGPMGAAYVDAPRLWTASVLRSIRKCGGVPVLAHPYQLDRDEDGLVRWLKRMKSNGLVGLECYHSGCSPEQAQWLRQVADAMLFLPTGGSDFHGANRPGVRMGQGLSRWRDRENTLDRLTRAMNFMRTEGCLALDRTIYFD